MMFILTVVYVSISYAEQVPLIWLLWLPVDFPWSLINVIGGSAYSKWYREVSRSSAILEYILYTPYLVHGVIGTVWWYYLPKIITIIRKKIT